MSGPVLEDADEVTGRETTIGDAGTRHALDRLHVRIEELAREMRKRDHEVRNDLTATLRETSDTLTEHVREDEARHVDLVGRPGGGIGRVGALEKARVEFERRLGAEEQKRREDFLRLERSVEAQGETLEGIVGLKKSITRGLRGAIAAAALSSGAAIGFFIGAIRADERAVIAERARVEMLERHDRTITVLVAAMWRAGIFLPDLPAPLPGDRHDP